MSNPRNIVSLTGRIPDTEKIKFEFKEGDTEEKNFFWGNISVMRTYKAKDSDYYEEDLIPFKAFGKTASYINNYVQRGDTVTAVGELRISDNYEKDGKIIYGTPYLHIDFGGMSRVSSKNARTSASDAAGSPPKAQAAVKNNPLVNRRRRSVI